jgi:guanine deaminase
MVDPEELMRLAIRKARESIGKFQLPFGCAIAIGNHLFADHNRILETGDVTAHAEIVALRQAGKETGQIYLEGGLVASTSEPCAMCIGALHWARVKTVWFVPRLTM